MTHYFTLFLFFDHIQDHFSKPPGLHSPSHLKFPSGPLAVYCFGSNSESYLLFPSLLCDGPHLGTFFPSESPQGELEAVPLLSIPPPTSELGQLFDPKGTIYLRIPTISLSERSSHQGKDQREALLQSLKAQVPLSPPPQR